MAPMVLARPRGVRGKTEKGVRAAVLILMSPWRLVFGKVLTGGMSPIGDAPPILDEREYCAADYRYGGVDALRGR